MKNLFLLVFFFEMTKAISQTPKTIYHYKKYEKFDLGNLEVKGDLIAPGDISVRERERRRFELDLYFRKNFGDFKRKDVDSLR